MTAPTATLSVTDRYMLKALTLQQSEIVQFGKVMFCRGRKVLGFGKIEELSRVMLIPPGTDTVCLAPSDYADVKGWLG